MGSKFFMYFSTVVIFVMFIVKASVFAADGVNIGKISEINKISGEVTVASSKAGESIRMGDFLYIRIKGKTVLMKATFPMMTVAKCRLLPGYGKYLKEIPKNSPVFAYVKGIEKESDAAELQKSGSSKELAMLCGKHINSSNIKKYMKQLGKDYAVEQHSDSYYYSWLSKGISLRFDKLTNPDTLTTIFIYNQGVDGFSRYPYEWPENILPTDLREDVEKKIGTINSARDEYNDYPEFGFGINYVKQSANYPVSDPLKRKISSMYIQKPKLEK